MTFKKFNNHDIIRNTLVANPKVRFDVIDSEIYFNKQAHIPGKFSDQARVVPKGNLSLYELNIDRSVDDTGMISGSYYDTFSEKRIEVQYPLSASIERITGSEDSKEVRSLATSFSFYKQLSNKYNIDITSSAFTLVSIPSIFYGSSLKKGSVDIKMFNSGTLIAEASDINNNGELVQYGPLGSTSSGSTIGLILYNEGFLYLTGTLNQSLTTPAITWISFASGSSGPISTNPSASYSFEFRGTNHIPTMTMFAKANKGEFNHSNNRTYIKSGSLTQTVVGPRMYEEPKETLIKNIVDSTYEGTVPQFEKITYISKIGVYNKEKELIAIATLANPIKKETDRDITFKLKLDL